MGSLDHRRWGTGLAVALASVAAITVANYGLRELVPVVSTGVVYMLAVLLVSSRWGLWPGLLTGLLSAAAFNFFHLPPTGRFTIATEENWVALAIFLVVAAVTSKLADAARAREAEAEHPPAGGRPHRGDGAAAARWRGRRGVAAAGRPADRRRRSTCRRWTSSRAGWTATDAGGRCR